ncbi:response regulator transcription factor [Lysinibacter sp. HNR]|uniref:winged helix-turn-helix transcriptional regulator n=1 Tax=Lysinibacter sp. HNR TaxID=3031408 RepID=UPI002434ED4F|nr:response regulator transcription factor [Lysinibacter sp. HNR]WGD38117.1 response regulator transcription factor [Lysinibacter sp. HNR]
MAQVLVLTNPGGDNPLPALGLLNHHVRYAPPSTGRLREAPSHGLILIDARNDLAGAKTLCKMLGASGVQTPAILIVTEGGFTVIGVDWPVSDIILDTAGPAEIDARIRLALGRSTVQSEPHRIQASGVSVDEANYSAKVRGKPLDLTYKEFELLRFFTTNPDRVFTREQLLSEVWGYDYFGGTRTVDVHVRRLRAKLGDREQLIGTVRNVGYRFNLAEDDNDEEGSTDTSPDSKS